MTFGLSAAAIVGAGTAAAGAYTAYKSSKSGGGASQTTKQEIDPRVDPYIYGTDGKGGLLQGAYDLYEQQKANGGLNGMQSAGLEMQRQALVDPAYGAVGNAQRNAGMALLGGGALTNPFASGQVGANGRYIPPQYTQQQIAQTVQQLPNNSLPQLRQAASDKFGISGNQFDMANINSRPPAMSAGVGAALQPIGQPAMEAAPAALDEDALDAAITAYLKKNLPAAGPQEYVPEWNGG